MDKLLLLGGLLVILLGATYGHTIPRNYIFHPEAGVWVKFHLNRLKWEEAVLKCHSEGAILASPLNANFSRAITSVMCAAPVFTGISNVYSSTEYQSVEGVPLSNICVSWPDAVEPEVDEMKKNCVALDANGVATVVPCSRRLPFVCYKEERRELNQCGTADPGYILDNRTGSCYKIVDKVTTWPEAFKICAREGGHLPIINTEAEAEVLMELAKKSPDTTINYVNLGFYPFGDQQREWMTIHGQSLVEAGYSRWTPGQPDGSGRCGAMYAGGAAEKGVLDDGQCDYERKTICEIDPKMKTIPNV